MYNSDIRLSCGKDMSYVLIQQDIVELIDVRISNCATGNSYKIYPLKINTSDRQVTDYEFCRLKTFTIRY